MMRQRMKQNIMRSVVLSTFSYTQVRTEQVMVLWYVSLFFFLNRAMFASEGDIFVRMLSMKMWHFLRKEYSLNLLLTIFHGTFSIFSKVSNELFVLKVRLRLARGNNIININSELQYWEDTCRVAQRRTNQKPSFGFRRFQPVLHSTYYCNWLLMFFFLIFLHAKQNADILNN